MKIRHIWLWGPLVLGLLACDSGSSSGPESSERTLTILYTNDEHGWIEEGPETDGAAKLMGLWRDAEGYTETGDFLILSGGDNWTGPAISTWFQGESTVDVMNAMEYDASTLGNHEFDFTVDGLRARIAQAEFPFLAANIRTKGTTNTPDFATPFTIKNVNGIRVGLVGLASTSTSWTTFPAHVENYDFVDYQEALLEWVPRVWDAGADLVVVMGHICYDEMLPLLPTVQQLDVSVLTGGHCNEVVGEVRDDVALVIGGWQLARYGRVVVGYDEGSGEVTRLGSRVALNSGGSPDAVVQGVVATWQDAAAAELSDVVGYAQDPVPNGSPALYNLVTDSWLFAYPTADIVMTNAGGIRQGIPAGDVNKGTIVGILPFLNNLVELELSGAEVIDCLRASTVVGGMSTVGGYFHSDGTPIKLDSLYTVLTTDYLYSLDGQDFDLYDQTPYNTGITYFQPTVDYLEALNTSVADPLDGYLDHVARR
ncbi:MAG: bifunctional UDP-sugar hydrolase/5'-nucleotidase [Gemmatimonadota bacterium]|jgi:2',3'-cyclic-nucleotide 2'-phosphodiesterase (5'-nucleotidase family)